MITLKYPIENEMVSLQTGNQRRFFEEEQKRAKMDGSFSFRWYDLKKQGEDDTIPAPVSFRWNVEIEEESTQNGYYYLLISETEDLKSPIVYVTDQCSHEVYNLKCGTKYYWCVQKNGKRSAIGSFETLLALPRCIKLDGISNVRDIGGYQVSGGRIRQGLVYRGGEFELHMQLTPQGALDLKELGIRCELDMRGEAQDKVDFTTAEVLGIKRAYVPSVPYHRIFDKNNRRSIKNFFRVFCSPKNYPIYFHCWGGADRTGTFAFILGAFLGMSYQDLINEYEFTSLSIWGIRTRNHGEFCDFLNLFMALRGENLQEKASTFLKEYAGLSDKQLSVIYDTLVEKDIPAR